MVCVVGTVTATGSSAAATDDDSVNDTQLVSVAITWSRIYYITVGRRLCSRGELNSDNDSSVQATKSHTSCQQCLQVS